MEFYFNELQENKESFDTYFKAIKVIGAGSYGTVVHAVHLGLKREVAVKRIKIDSKNEIELNKIMQEGLILKNLRHKNVVQFLDLIQTKDEIYIIMEYIKQGTLKSYMNKRFSEENYFSEEEVSIIIKSLLEAAQYLHSFHIVHRDIKPENILVSNYKDLTSIKIADFGLSSLYFERSEDYEACGTLIYMAPEQINKKYYTKGVDIWSCGIIMYMLLNKGKHPLYDKRRSKIEYIQSLQKPVWVFKNTVSKMAENLFRKLVEVYHLQRYSADEALRHPFITRNHLDDIPLTYLDNINLKESKRKIKDHIGMILFCMFFSKKRKRTVNQVYTDKVNAVTLKQKEDYLRNRENCLQPIVVEDAKITEENNPDIVTFKRTFKAKLGTQIESVSKVGKANFHKNVFKSKISKAIATIPKDNFEASPFKNEPKTEKKTFKNFNSFSPEKVNLSNEAKAKMNLEKQKLNYKYLSSKNFNESKINIITEKYQDKETRKSINAYSNDKKRRSDVTSLKKFGQIQIEKFMNSKVKKPDIPKDNRKQFSQLVLPLINKKEQEKIPKKY